jgi:GTP-binding protein Era
MLKKIGTRAREDIERLMGMKVVLKLWVKVKEDWRNSDFMLNELGYKS